MNDDAFLIYIMGVPIISKYSLMNMHEGLIGHYIPLKWLRKTKVSGEAYLK